jgi:hypothetical protein
LVAIPCASAVAGVIPDGTTVQYYRGKTANDKNSFLEFDAYERPNGKRTVERFYFARVDVNCKGDAKFEAPAYLFRTSMKVGPRREFKGRESGRSGEVVFVVRLKGRFRRNGNAAGTMKIQVRGQVCKTRWLAEPRDVPPPR